MAAPIEDEKQPEGSAPSSDGDRYQTQTVTSSEELPARSASGHGPDVDGRSGSEVNGIPPDANPQPDQEAPLPLSAVSTQFYSRIREEGRGGIGIVHRAKDRRLGRLVAVKELLSSSASLAARLRFEREMRVTAKLQHPGIVPVHEAGLWPDGSPFYTMKLIEGRSLKAMISERTDLPSRLELLPHVVAIADAVAYAHSRGVIHRDLKPSNVVVGAFGETIVIDWGLAKELDSDDSFPDEGVSSGSSDLTQHGAVVGTPAYMPPEQASGVPVDERADVYSIGMILHHILTGRASLAVLPVGDATARVDADLLAILAKATSPARESRYRDAGELAADLHRYQTGQVVAAATYGVREMLLRWYRRHRVAVSVSAVASVLVLLVAAVSFIKVLAASRESDRQRAIAVDRALARDAALKEVKERAETSVLDHAKAVAESDPVQSLGALLQLDRRTQGSAEARQIALRAFRAGMPSAYGHVALRGSLEVFDPQISLDERGEFLAVAEYASVSVWRLRDGHVEHRWSIEPPGNSTAVSALVWLDASRLFIARSDGREWLLDGSGAVVPLEFGHGAVVNASLDRASRRLALAMSDGTILIASAPSSTGPWATVVGGTGNAVCWAGNRRIVITHEGLVAIARTDGVGVRQVDVSAAITALRCSADGGVAVIGTRDGRVTLVDVDTGRLRATKQIYRNTPIFQVGLLNGGKVLVSAAVGGELNLWTVEGDVMIRYQRHQHFSDSPDGIWLIGASSDGYVTLHNARSGFRRRLMTGSSGVAAVAVSSKGAAAVLTIDGGIRLYGDGLVPIASIDVPTTVSSIEGAGDKTVLSSADGSVGLVDWVGGSVASAAVCAEPVLVRILRTRRRIAALCRSTGAVQVFDASLQKIGAYDGGLRMLDMRANGDLLTLLTADGGMTILSEGSAGNWRGTEVATGIARMRLLEGGDIIAATKSHRLIHFAGGGVETGPAQELRAVRIVGLAAIAGPTTSGAIVAYEDGVVERWEGALRPNFTGMLCPSGIMSVFGTAKGQCAVVACVNGDVTVFAGEKTVALADLGRISGLSLEPAQLDVAVSTYDGFVYDWLDIDTVAASQQFEPVFDIDLDGEVVTTLSRGRLDRWRLPERGSPALVDLDQFSDWIVRTGQAIMRPAE